jgi:phosphate transport system substrate-binding protein
VLLALPALLASCGTTDTPVSSGPPAGDARGAVAVSGSSTVAPISAFVADEFNYNGSPASITVDDPGTGDGLALFCEGEIQVAGASRPIKPEEVERCAAAGVELIELEVAFDGITVLTSAENAEVDCLAFADLYALLGPESGGIDRWSGAAALAADLGSTTDLPDAELVVTAPGTESGTYDAFVELVIGDVAEARVADGAIDEDVAEALRDDYSSQADDNSIIAGIEGSRHSLGFVGFAFAEGAGTGVRELEVDGGDGCVAPSATTIADGSYPIARSLYLYVDAEAAEEDAAVRQYIDYFLTDFGLVDLVEEAGYVPLPVERQEDTRDRWENRTTGSAVVPPTVEG